jgi:hypothetical protein
LLADPAFVPSANYVASMMNDKRYAEQLRSKILSVSFPALIYLSLFLR